MLFAPVTIARPRRPALRAPPPIIVGPMCDVRTARAFVRYVARTRENALHARVATALTPTRRDHVRMLASRMERPPMSTKVQAQNAQPAVFKPQAAGAAQQP